jgi:hypothetical protein
MKVRDISINKKWTNVCKVKYIKELFALLVAFEKEITKETLFHRTDFSFLINSHC